MQRIAQQTIDRFLLQVVDGSLAGVIFVVPLVMGGRHPLGQLLLAGLAVAMGLAWIGHLGCSEDASWRPTRAALLLLAGLALVLLQTAPLSVSALQWLAPRSADLLPLWNPAKSSNTGLGVWQYLSLTPAETRAGLAVFLAYGLVFLVVVERIRTVEDVERLLRWCALSAIGMAAFGLVQFFAGNGKFFWTYEFVHCTTQDAVKGSFTNRNHFAQFMALGIGPLIWWLQDAMRRMRAPGRASGRTLRGGDMSAYLLSLSLGIVLFAGLMSLSRAGIVAMLLATAIGTAVCYRTASLGKRFLAVLAAAGVLIGVSLMMFGYDRIANRLDSVSSGSVEKLDFGSGRRMIWAATAKIIPNHLLLGTGVGSFSEVYPVYADAGIDAGIEFTHGENCYLQIALETGAVGLALVLGGIALCGWWCCRGLVRSSSSRLQLCAGAIAASVAASVAHAAVDFIWYVPGCVAMTVVLAASALRVRQLADQRAVRHWSVRLPKFAPAVAWASLLLTGGWMISTLTGPALAASSWNQYRMAAAVLEVESNAAEGLGSLSATSGRLQSSEIEERLIADLEGVVAWQPTHARAHLELAESHLRLFEKLQTTAVNPMSLLNIRDAVVQSHFPSQKAMLEWLSRAVGEHWIHIDKALQHTRRALLLCPLHGRGYTYLAELCFLEQGSRLSPAIYLEQALRVRPFDGTVLSGAASEAYLAGNSEKWLEYAKRAFHSGHRQQLQLMDGLIGHASAENVPVLVDFIVREFEPDLHGLRFLCAACAKRCPAEQLAPLVQYRAKRTESEASRSNSRAAATLWLEAYLLHSQLRNGVEALKCARNALQSDPGNYDVHFHLAMCLVNQRLFADAEPHLRWCLQRAPGDPTIEAKLRETLKGRLDGERRASVEGERTRAR
jgi:O-antigen ligase/tetratricopeptide (TPR) repeat protein